MMAFEESIGYMCGTQVLDKDGVSAAIRAAELIAYLDEINTTLMDKLNDIYTRYVCRNQFEYALFTVLFFGLLLIYTFNVITISALIYLTLIPLSYIHYQKLKKQNQNEKVQDNDDDDLEDVL